jgi:hypothetical protein
MKLVKEIGNCQVSGTCDILDLDRFGSHKIEFNATDDPIKRKITSFELTSRLRL